MLSIVPNYVFVCISLSVDFSINVLSSGSWPFQQGAPFALSVDVSVCVCVCVCGVCVVCVYMCVYVCVRVRV